MIAKNTQCTYGHFPQNSCGKTLSERRENFRSRMASGTFGIVPKPWFYFAVPGFSDAGRFMIAASKNLGCKME